MKTIRISRGVTLTLPGKPLQRIDSGPDIDRVAWTPPSSTSRDCELLVQVRQKVAAGDALLIDKYEPQVLHVAPASGEITDILYDEDKRVSHIIISLNDQAPKPFSIVETPYTQPAIKTLLMQSGLWTHLRQRPFDTVPSANVKPNHILITAMDTRPSAPDVVPIISLHHLEFQAGLDALATQTAGSLWVCQAPGDQLAQTTNNNIKTVAFSGAHPAGAPSLHIQQLRLTGNSQVIWHIDYQDVIALGFLLLHGYIQSQRVLALSGNQIRTPRLITTTLGANIADLLDGEIIESSDKPCTTIGSYCSGQTKAWLGRFDRQITAMKNITSSATDSSIVPTAKTAGFVAEPVFDNINAFDFLPAPLFRALASGDFNMAEKLGCLELMPEDLDIFDSVCPQGNSYTGLLESCNQSLMQRELHNKGQRQDAV